MFGDIKIDGNLEDQLESSKRNDIENDEAIVDNVNYISSVVHFFFFLFLCLVDVKLHLMIRTQCIN